MRAVTVYCLSFSVKIFRCFMSLPSIPKNIRSQQLLQAFIVFMCKNSPKTFTVVKQFAKMQKFFTANNKQYTVSAKSEVLLTKPNQFMLVQRQFLAMLDYILEHEHKITFKYLCQFIYVILFSSYFNTKYSFILLTFIYVKINYVKSPINA